MRRYFEWLCDMIGGFGEHQKLLQYLFDTDFYYILDMDENRAKDGISLRWHFRHSDWAKKKPCSVLEMMIALAKRCEEDIMADSEMGDRTGLWFWNMVTHLGLMGQDDSHFEEEYVRERVECLLNREYEPDGNGGLFYLPGIQNDMRTEEIWYQAMWYLYRLKE